MFFAKARDDTQSTPAKAATAGDWELVTGVAHLAPSRALSCIFKLPPGTATATWNCRWPVVAPHFRLACWLHLLLLVLH